MWVTVAAGTGLLLVAVALTLGGDVLRRRLGPSTVEDADRYGVAYLAGGATRAGLLAVVALLDSGRLRLDVVRSLGTRYVWLAAPPGFAEGTRAPDHDLERWVLALVAANHRTSVHTVNRTVRDSPPVLALRRELTARGLLLRTRQRVLLGAAMWGAVLPVAAVALLAGPVRHAPALLLILAVPLLWAHGVENSAAGTALLRRERAEPAEPRDARAVALRGYAGIGDRGVREALRRSARHHGYATDQVFVGG